MLFARLHQKLANELPDESAFGSSQRLATWRSRPLVFKIAHRMNTLLAFAKGEVTLRSCLGALVDPHCVVALARREPHRGMIYVCPAWIQELEDFAAADPRQVSNTSGT